MTVGSLFAGIGGFDLGFERAGYEIVWQVEIDEYCRRVLERHFPRAERFGDIRDCGAHNLGPVDVICGGFPCQPVSLAGNRLAQKDERWLWPEFARIICELRPKFVVVENVPGLLTAGMGDVLGELASIRYDAEWQSISAFAIGAPHLRHRIWIVAYPDSSRCGEPYIFGEQQRRTEAISPRKVMANATGRSKQPGSTQGNVRRFQNEILPEGWYTDHWNAEPNVGRVAHGVSRRVDRLRGLGNAIVPQIAQWIAERIKAVTSESNHLPR